MDALERGLLSSARRSYEIGRLDFALRRALLALPVFGLALTCCGDARASLASGALLVAAVVACLWRGEAFGRGVRPGLLAGIVPLLLPLVAQSCAHACHAGRCLLYPTVCVLGGLAGGVALALLAPRPREAQGIPLVVASLVAGLAGSVGCFLYGLVGVAGMLVGLLAGAAPLLALRRARG